MLRYIRGMIPPELEPLLIPALLAALALACFGWWVTATKVARGNAARGEVARNAEVEAEALVEELGYTVVDRQVMGRMWMVVDSEPVEITCRADLLLFDGTRRWVAEVKSAARVANPAWPATRRQLLEYHLAFGVDGVLLIDMARREVQHVTFPDLLRTTRPRAGGGQLG